MNIFVVRHGITDWNLQRRAQGREDIPLNKYGILQARDCGSKIQGLSIDYMVSSPLCRAVRTAEIIGEFLGVREVRTMEAFTEMDFGQVSGATQEELHRRREEEGNLGIETREAVRERAVAGVQQLQEEYGDANIMLVSHGALIRNLLRYYVEESAIPEFFENCGISWLSFEQGKVVHRLINALPERFMEEYKRRYP